ncbi:MAG: ribonuclease HI [Treponemataceae bacterium]|nr:MAG: ribonuclease HI [Treponemataceae bacterium]
MREKTSEKTPKKNIGQILKKISEKLPTAEKKIIAYTDGSCSGNPGPGGWGCVIVVSGTGKAHEFSGREGATTNNRMELTAAIEVLCKIRDNSEWKSLPITLHSDSTYVRNGITEWIEKWKKNGWRSSDKKPVKNRDLWEALDALNSDLSVEWQWVKGHDGNFFNERCDKLARGTI